MPRKSPHRTVVAIVREKLGMDQKEFAARLGIPAHVLRDVELGKTTLPLKIAWGISFWGTGGAVSVEQLLANQLDVPIPDDIKERAEERKKETAKLTPEDFNRYIIQARNDYSDYDCILDATDELLALAQKLGCDEQGDDAQLRWLARFAFNRANDLEEQERNFATPARRFKTAAEAKAWLESVVIPPPKTKADPCSKICV